MMNKKAQLDGSHWFLIFVLLFVLLFSGWWMLTGKTIDTPLDSDGDGLSDKEEDKIGTDINNPNTDGDRYLDGEDEYPLKINSAEIGYYKINEEEDYHILSIAKNTLTMGLASVGLAGCGSSAIGVCAKNSISLFNSIEKSLDDVIYTSSGEVIFSNTGDDYTNYINFNLVYRMSGEVLYELPLEIGRLLPNKRVSVPYSHDLKIGDVKYVFWDMIVSRKKIEVSVERVDYEKFS